MPILTGVIFAETVNETMPVPVPVPLVIVIQESVVTAVQLHPALLVVTLKLPLPPIGSKLALVGVNVNVQPLA